MDETTKEGRRVAAEPSHPLLDEDSRRLTAAAVAGAAIGWWPAFTMGVYGVIFFEQHLALWAVATTAFLALGYARGAKVWRRPGVLALLLPSSWMVLAWLLPVGGSTGIYQALFWLGVTITVLGMPALAAFMVRLVIPTAARLRAGSDGQPSASSLSSCSRRMSWAPSTRGCSRARTSPSAATSHHQAALPGRGRRSAEAQSGRGDSTSPSVRARAMASSRDDTPSLW